MFVSRSGLTLLVGLVATRSLFPAIFASWLICVLPCSEGGGAEGGATRTTSEFLFGSSAGELQTAASLFCALADDAGDWQAPQGVGGRSVERLLRGVMSSIAGPKGGNIGQRVGIPAAGASRMEGVPDLGVKLANHTL